MTRLRIVVAALVVVATVCVVWWLAGDSQKHATVYFERAAGIHVGDDVRVLGVRVGEIEEIQPEGTQVRVRFGYDADRKVPADTKVALVAPSLVSGRYLQLAPVYRGGPVLSEDAVIPRQRTMIPAEWDQTSAELTELTKALGPDGANRDGAVSRLVRTGAANLGGNGEEFRRMLQETTRTSTTLAAGSEDAFATVRNLNEFTATLNASDQQLRAFSTQLASISALAEDNRRQLGDAIAASDRALVAITDLTARNNQQLGDTVVSLRDVTATLAASRADLAEVLHAAPQTLANLYNVYDPDTASAAARVTLPYTSSLSTFTCQSLLAAGGTIDDCRAALDPLLRYLDTPYPPVGLTPVERPGTPYQRPPGGGG